MKFKELLEKVPDEQVVELKLVGGGSMRSDSCMFCSALADRVLDLKVLSAEAKDDVLRVWVLD